jgi:hypothetical protein
VYSIYEEFFKESLLYVRFILGIPYLNQYDAASTDLSDMFTVVPDFTPYNAIPVDRRMFDPVKANDPIDEEFNWAALKESPILDLPD